MRGMDDDTIRKVCEYLEEGDMVFFNSKAITSVLIKYFSNSKYNHVGTVWVCPITGTKYLWESRRTSTKRTEYVSITANKKRGYQTRLSALYARLKKSRENGTLVCVRKLQQKKGVQIPKTMEYRYDLFVAEHIGKSYVNTLLKTWTKMNNPFGQRFNMFEDDDEFTNKLTLDSWMCSQMVLYTCNYVGYIGLIDTKFPGIVTPGDLSSWKLESPFFYYNEIEKLF